MSADSIRVPLDYGTTGLIVELPRDRTTVIEPLFAEGLERPHAALRDALRNPIGSPPLRECVKPGDKIDERPHGKKEVTRSDLPEDMRRVTTRTKQVPKAQGKRTIKKRTIKKQKKAKRTRMDRKKIE